VIVNNSIFPVDFVVIDVPKHPFCPIIFGKPFHMSTNLKIDNKRGIVALKLGEEEFQFNFSKFKNQPYEKEVDTKEDDLLPCLAIIYGETPKML
jgi:hypothetical protein